MAVEPTDWLMNLTIEIFRNTFDEMLHGFSSYTK